MRLPPALNEAGEQVQGHGKYARLQGHSPTDKLFVPYVPTQLMETKASSGQSAALKMR